MVQAGAEQGCTSNALRSAGHWHPLSLVIPSGDPQGEANPRIAGQKPEVAARRQRVGPAVGALGARPTRLPWRERPLKPGPRGIPKPGLACRLEQPMEGMARSGCAVARARIDDAHPARRPSGRAPRHRRVAVRQPRVEVAGRARYPLHGAQQLGLLNPVLHAPGATDGR